MCASFAEDDRGARCVVRGARYALRGAGYAVRVADEPECMAQCLKCKRTIHLILNSPFLLSYYAWDDSLQNHDTHYLLSPLSSDHSRKIEPTEVGNSESSSSDFLIN